MNREEKIKMLKNVSQGNFAELDELVKLEEDNILFNKYFYACLQYIFSDEIDQFMVFEDGPKPSWIIYSDNYLPLTQADLDNFLNEFSPNEEGKYEYEKMSLRTLTIANEMTKTIKRLKKNNQLYILHSFTGPKHDG